MAQRDVEVDQQMAPRDVEVRGAQFEDYQAVMDISQDIYNGRDYLPKMYYVFLQDKNSNCFVILLNGRIVSTSLVFIFAHLLATNVLERNVTKITLVSLHNTHYGLKIHPRCFCLG